MTESLAYRVLETDGDVELRQYSAYIVAEVDVEADGLRSAAERGFRPLADYIFGANVPKDKIAMTTPVTAESTGTEIAMTTPVTSSPTSSVEGPGTYTVRFSMPSAWTMDTLPAPTNPDVRLVEVPSRLMVAVRFRGRDDANRIAAGGEALLSFATAHDLTPEGSPAWAGYSAPYIPVPLRKWEMLLPVRRP